MSARKTEQEVAVRHPRETAELFGHREAETALLNAYRSGRIPHAWLIGGAQGIGKATLAYRMARFVLANSSPMSPSVQQRRCGKFPAIQAARPWHSSPGSATRRSAMRLSKPSTGSA